MELTHAERELAAQMADLSYPLDSFSHAEHVRLAWTLLAEQPLLEGMRTFRRVLQAYAAHHDAAEMYNETVMIFYLLLIRDRWTGSTGITRGKNSGRRARTSWARRRRFWKSGIPAARRSLRRRRRRSACGIVAGA